MIINNCAVVRRSFLLVEVVDGVLRRFDQYFYIVYL